MITYDLAIQGPQNRSSVLKSIQRIVPLATFTRFTGLFAYATKGGVDLLLNVLKHDIKRWDSISKRWVVSIDFARTEPFALERLISLKNSEVRVPYFAEVLKRKFNPVTCFHAKTIMLDTPEHKRGPLALIVSSANLTVSGLTLGHENALSMMWRKSPLPGTRTPWDVLVKEVEHVVPGLEGPPDYKNKTLLFSRKPDGSFLLNVGSPQEVKKWKKVSNVHGTLYPMKGGRKYGLFG